MTQAEIAWAAGIFEGEGCIYLRKKARGSILSMASTDLDILQRFQRITGGHVYKKNRSSCPDHWKPQWEWRLAAIPEVYSLLLSFMPYFGLRRAYTAQNALDKIDRV